MTSKSIRDYINLIENSQQGVAEGSLGTYVLNVMDAVTGEHWAIEIQASSPDMAKERAQQQGYKVLRIKEKGVAEEQVEESIPDALTKIDDLFRK